MAWHDDNEWEKKWWGSCANTFWEETKQQVYARKMSLTAESDFGKYPVFNLNGKTVLDIGGGPVSLLLKCKNLGQSAVVDPCEYPEWVAKRYEYLDIDYHVKPAEDIGTRLQLPVYDEVWIYNVLQHTIDPKLILENALKAGRIIRLFEWIDTDITEGHPHVLTEEKLNNWLGGEGHIEEIDENGCHGKCYYGVFIGNNYAKI